MTTSLRVQNHILEPNVASGLPPCSLQLILLPSQTMLWLGSAVNGQTQLGTDWSVAMPGFGVRLIQSELLLFALTPERRLLT